MSIEAFIVGALVGLLLGGAAVWLVLRERLLARERAADQLSDRFRALAGETLERSQESFLRLAETRLGGFQERATAELEQRRQAVESLVAPIRESLDRVGSEVRSIEQARREAYAELRTQVQSLAQTQSDLRAETSGLVRALRTPGVRGSWGEMQLRRAVETAGLLERCDFVLQATVTADDRMLRPDLVVRLPGGKQVVVDAKAPVEALLAAHDAADDAERQARMADFVRHVRDHLAKLSAKAYWEQFESAPDFVIMFLPGESFFRYALEQDPSLLEQGPGQRVILASPTILITMLRAIAVGWREEKIAESAREISERGRELYERLATMGQHVDALGKRLDGAVKAYNETVASLETRVLPSARRFPELGVAVKAPLPPVTPIERAAKPLTAAELTAQPPELTPVEPTAASAA
jgi:DNA recombination protein RmuC